tara:strand:- start:121 stop:312 length:192 start_codon:yes stop_codon:yes gene_type:complete
MRKLTTNEIIISIVVFAIIVGIVVLLVKFLGKPSSTTTSFNTDSGDTIGIRQDSDGSVSLNIQ